MSLSSEAEKFFESTRRYLSEYVDAAQMLGKENLAEELELFVETNYRTSGEVSRGEFSTKPRFLDFEYSNNDVDMNWFTDEIDDILEDYQELLSEEEYRDIPFVHNQNRLEEIQEFREKFTKEKTWL